MQFNWVHKICITYVCVCVYIYISIYIAVTAPAQNAGSHDFVTLATVICQQLKSEQVFFLQQVFIVEYHLSSNSDLSRMKDSKMHFSILLCRTN